MLRKRRWLKLLCAVTIGYGMAACLLPPAPTVVVSKTDLLDATTSNTPSQTSPIFQSWFQAKVASLPKTGIPRVMIFMHKTNLLGPHVDPYDLKYFDNVVRTIFMYAHAWTDDSSSGRPPPLIWFLDDEECIRAISLVEPTLVRHYRNERDGSFKGYMCRGAALFLTGGYYFDVDVQAIFPVLLPKKVTFASALSVNGAFQSFLASTRENAIVRDYLRILAFHYQHRDTLRRMARFRPRKIAVAALGRSFMRRNDVKAIEEFFKNIPPARKVMQGRINPSLGPSSMEAAVRHHLKDAQENMYFLSEKDMNDIQTQWLLYPDMQFQVGGVGSGCNFLLRDIRLKQPHFFSRFVGSNEACHHMDSGRAEPTTMLSWSERKSKLNSLGVEYIHLPLVLK